MTACRGGRHHPGDPLALVRARLLQSHTQRAGQHRRHLLALRRRRLARALLHLLHHAAAGARLKPMTVRPATSRSRPPSVPRRGGAWSGLLVYGLLHPAPCVGRPARPQLRPWPAMRASRSERRARALFPVGSAYGAVLLVVNLVCAGDLRDRPPCLRLFLAPLARRIPGRGESRLASPTLRRNA